MPGRSSGGSGSDHFTYRPPPEARTEYRVAVAHSWSEWKFKQAEYNYRCGYCGIKKKDTPEGYLTRDHRRPDPLRRHGRYRQHRPGLQAMQLPEGKPVAATGGDAIGTTTHALSRMDNLIVFGIIATGLVVCMLAGIGLYSMLRGFCG